MFNNYGIFFIFITNIWLGRAYKLILVMDESDEYNPQTHVEDYNTAQGYSEMENDKSEVADNENEESAQREDFSDYTNIGVLRTNTQENYQKSKEENTEDDIKTEETISRTDFLKKHVEGILRTDLQNNKPKEEKLQVDDIDMRTHKNKHKSKHAATADPTFNILTDILGIFKAKSKKQEMKYMSKLEKDLKAVKGKMPLGKHKTDHSVPLGLGQHQKIHGKKYKFHPWPLGTSKIKKHTPKFKKTGKAKKSYPPMTLENQWLKNLKLNTEKAIHKKLSYKRADDEETEVLQRAADIFDYLFKSSEA